MFFLRKVRYIGGWCLIEAREEEVFKDFELGKGGGRKGERGARTRGLSSQ